MLLLLLLQRLLLLLCAHMIACRSTAHRTQQATAETCTCWFGLCMAVVGKALCTLLKCFLQRSADLLAVPTAAAAATQQSVSAFHT